MIVIIKLYTVTDCVCPNYFHSVVDSFNSDFFSVTKITFPLLIWIQQQLPLHFVNQLGLR